MTQRFASVVAALGLALVPAWAGGAPTTFGERTIDIPAPTGFVAVGDHAPEFMQRGRAFLPSHTRLVEVFLLPADFEEARAGRPAGMSQYAQLQVVRGADGVIVAPEEFAAELGRIRASIEADLDSLMEPPDESMARGNAALQSETGSPVEVEIGGTRAGGIYRDEPWGVFFSSSSEVVVSAGILEKRARVVTGVAVVLIDGQVLAFTVYDDRPAAQAHPWAQAAVSAWVDAARAANAKP